MFAKYIEYGLILHEIIYFWGVFFNYKIYQSVIALLCESLSYLEKKNINNKQKIKHDNIN